jgi:CubicO group peptidase (beta-lactamase class C family)
MRFALSLILLISLASCQDYDWTSVDDKISYYQFNGAFAGGVLRVANGTHNLYTKPFGYFTNQNIPYGTIPFTNESLFDIASLTKVTATLACVMHLVDQGRIGVDDIVSKYIPEYANHGK